jgi:hypothetical protein
MTDTELPVRRGGTLVRFAGVVELADTRALGARARKSVRVRVPPPALISTQFRAYIIGPTPTMDAGQLRWHGRAAGKPHQMASD